jgi:Ohr subfamily peroxiredoxin
MTVLYKTQATAKAGRNGNVATDDNLLNVDLSYPKEMGGNGTGTNPEQLFAAGYAACFSNAVLHIAREKKMPVKDAPVEASVGLISNDDGGFALTVSLSVTLEMPQDSALDLVRAAHAVCPYSNAVKGNIAVSVSVNGDEI